LSITAKFRVNRDRVSLEIPEKNLLLDKPNVIFFDSQNNGILGIGVPEETIRTDFVKQGKELPDNLKFGISFQYDDTNSAFFDSIVVEYYMADLYFAKQAIPVTLNSIDYEFQIEDYGKWDEQRRLSFEYALQANLRGRTVKVNGIQKDVPISKRRVEKLLRLFLRGLLSSAALLGAIYIGFEKSTSFFDVILVFVGFISTIFIGYIIWALVANILLPKPFLSFLAPDLMKSREQKFVEYLLNLYVKQ